MEPLELLKKRFQTEKIASIRAALRLSGGNIAEAARKLSIWPPNLHYKLKAYRLKGQPSQDKTKSY